MTQKSSMHVYSGGAPSPLAAGSPCNVFNIATGIVSEFSSFDVSETGSSMPCYCIQWNVSDKFSGALFQAELKEIRSSHDVGTATADHELYYRILDKNGIEIYSKEQDIGQLIKTADFVHPFGVPFQDTVAFYMSVFNDPADKPLLWHKFVQFFWYNFTRSPNAQIIGTGSALIPGWFKPTDLSIEFVGIEGDVQFSKELFARIQLGEQPFTGTNIVNAGPASPCVTQFGKQTSNAFNSFVNISQDRHSANLTVHV